jgi:DNA-binding CsgD family transcriptional regulator
MVYAQAATMGVTRPWLTLDLIDSLYEGATGGTDWRPFLRALERALGGVMPGLFVSNHGTDPDFALDPDLAPRWRRAFEDHYIRLDVRRPLIAALPEGSAIRGQDVISDNDFIQTEFYNDFLRPQNFFHIAAGVFWKDDRRVGVVRVLRPRRSRAFTKDDLDLLRILLPHVKRAVALREYHEVSIARREARETILNRWSLGVILLDGAGRIVWANQSASTILASNDGVRNGRGGLAARTAAETAGLKRLVASAAMAGDLRPGGGPIALSRAGRRPLTAFVAPVRTSGIRPNIGTGRVVVFMSDPDRKIDSPTEIVQQLFPITAAEARLTLLLAQGWTLAQASEQLDISVTTGRTHLKRILTKTGAGRQAELVRLVLNSPAALLPTQ